MATRRTFLHNSAAVGAGVPLAQAQTAQAAEEQRLREPAFSIINRDNAALRRQAAMHMRRAA